MNKYIRASIGAVTIAFMILWGFTLINLGYKFWGYINYFAGCLALYFVCLKYMDSPFFKSLGKEQASPSHTKEDKR